MKKPGGRPKTNVGLILGLGWPVALSAFLGQLMSTVDAFWVGRLGPVPLAAMGISLAVFGAGLALPQLVNAPLTALLMRFTDAEQRPLAQVILFHGLVTSLILAAFLMLVLLPLARPMLSFFGADISLMRVGVPYLRVLILTLPLMFLSGTSFAALQSRGDNASVLVVSAGTNLLNLILDPLLIFGWLGFPRLGLLGAGVATAVAALINLFVALLLLARKDLFRLAPVRGVMLGQFVRIGLVPMIQGLINPVSVLFFFYVVGFAGIAAQAALTVGLRLIAVASVFGVGIFAATQTVAARYIFAGKPQGAASAVRGSVLIGFLGQVLFSGLLFIGADLLMRFFVPGFLKVAGIGSPLLMIAAGFLLLEPFSLGFRAAQYGAGKTFGPTLASFAGNWIVKLFGAYVLSQVAGLGTLGLWLGLGLGIAAEAVINAAYYFKGDWRKVSHAAS